MALRSLTKDNPALSVVLSVIVIGAAGYFLASHFMGSPATGMGQPVFMYDLETGERFLSTLDDYPPTAAPSGPQNGVRVYVYGCGSCEEANLVNGYLEKLTPEGREAAIAKGKLTDMADVKEATRLDGVVRQNTLVRKVDGDQWHSVTSPAGQAIVNAALSSSCPGVVAIPCKPGQKSLY